MLDLRDTRITKGVEYIANWDLLRHIQGKLLSRDQIFDGAFDPRNIKKLAFLK